MSKKQNLRIGWGLVLLVLLAAPAFAGSDVIYNGVDIWKTPADGSSWQDFADDPIPADFFCAGSEPFTGRIAWAGLPLVTEPVDALHGRDTVIYRLDDAVFDDKGIATTRIQVGALSLIGTEPVQTSCGAFEVRATVAEGEQPVTEMRIERLHKSGGRFEAALEFIVKLTFRPVDNPLGDTLQLERDTYLESGSSFFWSSKPLKESFVEDALPRPQLDGFVLIDTDGNDKVDTFLPGTSNFFPYAVPEETDGEKAITLIPGPGGCNSWCHQYLDGHCHCNFP